MDQITRNKVLIGSLYKNINKARLFGTLDLKMLYFLEIVHSYILACEHPTKFKDVQKLNQLSLIIQNRYPEICNYRFNDLIKFANIVGCENCKPGLNNNPLGIFNSNPTISDPPVIDPQPECPQIICKLVFTTLYPKELVFVVIFEDDPDLNNLISSCYYSPSNSNASVIKFDSLPSFGILSFANEISGDTIIINQGDFINISDFSNGQLIYTYVVRGLSAGNLQDSFTFSIGDSNTPRLFTAPQTMFLIPI